MKSTLKASFVYFGVVFGAGFLFGAGRVLLLVPRIGARAAELSEAPLMLCVTLIAAMWLNGRFCRGFEHAQRLKVGLTSVAFVLIADIAVGVGLRGLSILDIFAQRDPVSGLVYYGLLAIFALAPWFFGLTPRTA